MSITYRPEIDGLRTVSVMLVILHHLGWSVVPGGFVGVDVFFVISGYLITKIVSTEIRDGTFSVGNFYKRRIIRLAPAYFLVLAVTTIASLLVMLPAELLGYFESVVYSIFFIANFYIWQEVGGYFGGPSELVPLLHLWSLAVEEQFYIFWPLGLLVILKIVPARFVLALLAVVVLAGLAVSEWGVQNYRAAAYYLMPTRAFELLLGALLVFLPARNWGGVTRNIMGLAGLALILYAAVTYSKEKLFPGFSAIVPILGASLILVFSEAKSDLAGRLLSTSPMTSIGRISYPAYLWHWPMIAFLNIYMVEIDLVVGIYVLAATLALSFLTHIYFENPAKRLNRHAVKKIVGYGFGVPALAFFGLASHGASEEGWPQRFPQSLNLKSEALHSAADRIRGRCNQGGVTDPKPEDQCVLGVADRPVDFLLIGDSHANHFTGMLDVMAKNAGVRGYDITQSNTLYLPDAKSYYLLDGERREYENFELRNAYLTQLIAEKKYKAVILAASFANHYDSSDFSAESGAVPKQVFEQKLEKAIMLIQDSGAVPYLIKGSPVLDGVVHNCTLKNQRFGLGADCDLEIEKHRAHFRNWNLLVDKLAAKYPKMLVIDPTKVMCNEVSCFTEINGIPLYKDSNHLNYMGSELIGQLYIARFGNPLSTLHGTKFD